MTKRMLRPHASTGVTNCRFAAAAYVPSGADFRNFCGMPSICVLAEGTSDACSTKRPTLLTVVMSATGTRRTLLPAASMAVLTVEAGNPSFDEMYASRAVSSIRSTSCVAFFLPDASTRPPATSTMAASTAMMPMTTRSSISVKPRRTRGVVAGMTGKLLDRPRRSGRDVAGSW